MKGAALTRWLHLGYCWLGMALGWFVSGIIMRFVTRPLLMEQEHLADLPAIAAGSVRLSPRAARLALIGVRLVWHRLTIILLVQQRTEIRPLLPFSLYKLSGWFWMPNRLHCNYEIRVDSYRPDQTGYLQQSIQSRPH